MGSSFLRSHGRKQEAIDRAELGLAGMELDFTAAALILLGFVLLARTVLLTPVLWPLLSSACTASRLLCSLPAPKRGMALGGDIARRADINLEKDIPFHAAIKGKRKEKEGDICY